MTFRIPTIAAALLAASALGTTPASAQMKPLSDPVVAHPDPASLFTSKDPKLNRNKQAALHIMKELLQCNQWNRAPEWITDRYIQHNPFAASGLKGVMDYFINVAKRPVDTKCEKLTSPIVAVQAEGDYVTVLTVRTLPMPGDPTKTYTTTWFDTWTFVDGKADEHWDPASLPDAPAPRAGGSVDAAMQRAKDREEIEALMWRYDRALDKFNADAYAAVYTEDGSFGQTKGREALRKMIAAFTEGGKEAPKLQHATSNHWIEFTGLNTAKIHYYWQTYALGSGKLDDSPKLLAAGNGLDEVVRVDGKWLFHSRTVVAPED